jgi:hypothetical protein
MMKPFARAASFSHLHVLALSVLVPACGLRTTLDLPKSRDAGLDLSPDGKSDGPGADRPELRPDLPPGPDLLPDVAPDRPSDLSRDVSGERLPDVLPPAERGPDQAVDLPRDVSVERVPDVLPAMERFPDVVIPVDRAPDRIGDLRFADLGVDLLPLLDGPCADGVTVPCTCSNGMAGQRICLPSHGWSECGCGTPELMRVRNGTLGTWTGTVTTPWVDPYAVTFSFDSYTHYSAMSLGSQNPALYYGTDDDGPDKHYDITDIEDNGDASGTIDIVFGPGNYTREILSGIQLSADGNTLRFWFSRGGTSGPLQYDLQRAPQ